MTVVRGEDVDVGGGCEKITVVREMTVAKKLAFGQKRQATK
jgi:hypothetical protein